VIHRVLIVSAAIVAAATIAAMSLDADLGVVGAAAGMGVIIAVTWERLRSRGGG
jgi:hypothetical protein